jgi:hypothetical protein
MAGACSPDLRERVLAAMEAGETPSRRRDLREGKMAAG